MFFPFIKKIRILLLLATSLNGVSAFLLLSLFVMIGNIGREGMESFNLSHFASTLIAMILVSIISSRLLSRLSTDSVYNVRESLIKRVLSTDSSQLSRVGSEKIYNVLINDVGAIASTLSEFPTFIYNVMLLVGFLSYLCYLSPKLFAVLLAGILLSGLLSRALIGRLATFARDMRHQEDGLMESYRGMLDGFAQLYINRSRLKHHFYHELCDNADALRKRERKFRFSWDLNRSVTSALVLMLVGATITMGQLLQQSEVIISYVLIITYSAGPFAVIMNLAQLFSRATVSINKIQSLSIADALPDAQLFDVPPAPQWQCIRFQQVQFEYPREGSETPFHLGPVELEIERGKVVFITGGNGSGKSTFISLLLGLADPQSGYICLDNRPIGAEDKSRYRSLFTTVLSEFHLFKTILDSSGNALAEEALLPLLERFKISGKVAFEESRLVSTRLSQGQKKRLALITAIAEDRDIVVLDEWAADQDPYFRQVFYEHIVPWLKHSGKTIVAVTHDERYFHLADECIKWESGRIAAHTQACQQPDSVYPVEGETVGEY